MTLHVDFKHMIFVDQIEPAGMLTRDKECHALWYYMVLATKNCANVGDGPESQTIVVPAGDEGAALWMDKRYEQIMRSVAAMYTTTPELMAGFWPCVEAEAIRMGIVIPNDVRWFAPGKIGSA
jgi:hypothetical protein